MPERGIEVADRWRSGVALCGRARRLVEVVTPGRRSRGSAWACARRARGSARRRLDGHVERCGRSCRRGTRPSTATRPDGGAAGNGPLRSILYSNSSPRSLARRARWCSAVYSTNTITSTCEGEKVAATTSICPDRFRRTGSPTRSRIPSRRRRRRPDRRRRGSARPARDRRYRPAAVSAIHTRRPGERSNRERRHRQGEVRRQRLGHRHRAEARPAERLGEHHEPGHRRPRAIRSARRAASARTHRSRVRSPAVQSRRGRDATPT